MSRKLSYLILFICGVQTIIANNSKIKKLVVSRLDGTYGNRLPVRTIFTLLKSEGLTLRVNIKSHFLEDISGSPKIFIYVTRCQSQENLDSCENYFKNGPISACLTMHPLSPMFIKFDPDLKCPVKKGTYVANNLTFDLSPFTVFPLEKWFWKVRVDIYEQNLVRLLSRVVGEGHALIN